MTSSSIYQCPLRYRIPAPPPDLKIIKLDNVTFDHYTTVRINDQLYHNLVQKIIYPLNNGLLNDTNGLKCHCTLSGVLFVSNMWREDIIHLNSLLYALVRLKGIKSGVIHYLSQCNDLDSVPMAFHFDRGTRMFNRYGQSISRCDFIDVFEGRVALSINGLRVIDDFQVFLDVTVHQVKMEEDFTANLTPDSQCIFH